MKEIKIGDKFTKLQDKKVKIIYTVVDIYTVTDSYDEFVRNEYIVSNEFMGQTIIHEVPKATIMRNKI